MKECFECGATADLQEHHVVPRLRGGTMTVTLCLSCHMKAHGRDSKGLNHSKLTKEGLAKTDKPLGTHNPVIQMAALEGKEAAKEAYWEEMKQHIIEAVSEGHTKTPQIALFLNKREIKNKRGGLWSAQSINPFWSRFKQECTEPLIGLLKN